MLVYLPRWVQAMASVSVPVSAGQRRLEPIVAIAAVVCLALWPVEIHTAFGLPAHPLILHVPVVFVPLLGLAAIALAIWPKLQDRFLLPVAVFSVVTMAATLLAAGAGEAFREDRERTLPRAMADNPTLQDHADAGSTVRLTVVLLTFVLVAMLFARRWPPAVRIVLRVLTVLLAATAIFFVIRTGHLGSKLAWGPEGGGAQSPGFQPGQGG
jgi:hypothetical protein